MAKIAVNIATGGITLSAKEHSCRVGAFPADVHPATDYTEQMREQTIELACTTTLMPLAIWNKVNDDSKAANNNRYFIGMTNVRDFRDFDSN